MFYQYVLRMILILALLADVFHLISLAYAQQERLVLPLPGTMVNVSKPFEGIKLRGITIYPNNPLRYDFFIDPGHQKDITRDNQDHIMRLVKYFLAGLAVRDEDLWVNLSPYERDKIVPEGLANTDLGRDLLAQDYLLKQISASMLYPESQLGKEFWQKVYALSQERLKTTNIPLSSFNKVWIVPDKVVVYQQGNQAIITQSRLKVLMDDDYLAISHQAHSNTSINDTHGDFQGIDKTIYKEVIIPVIEHEINEGKNFALIREIFASLILAKWYKQHLKGLALHEYYVNKKLVKGLELDVNGSAFVPNQSLSVEQIYQRYLLAYKKGVFNYVQEEFKQGNNEKIPRKYFSGGTNFAMSVKVVGNEPVNMRGFTASIELSPKKPEININEELKQKYTELLASAYEYITLPDAHKRKARINMRTAFLMASHILNNQEIFSSKEVGLALEFMKYFEEKSWMYDIEKIRFWELIISQKHASLNTEDLVNKAKAGLEGLLNENYAFGSEVAVIVLKYFKDVELQDKARQVLKAIFERNETNRTYYASAAAILALSNDGYFDDLRQKATNRLRQLSTLLTTSNNQKQANLELVMEFVDVYIKHENEIFGTTLRISSAQMLFAYVMKMHFYRPRNKLWTNVKKYLDNSVYPIFRRARYLVFIDKYLTETKDPAMSNGIEKAIAKLIQPTLKGDVLETPTIQWLNADLPQVENYLDKLLTNVDDYNIFARLATSVRLNDAQMVKGYFSNAPDLNFQQLFLIGWVHNELSSLLEDIEKNQTKIDVLLMVLMEVSSEREDLFNNDDISKLKTYFKGQSSPGYEFLKNFARNSLTYRLFQINNEGHKKVLRQYFQLLDQLGVPNQTEAINDLRKKLETSSQADASMLSYRNKKEDIELLNHIYNQIIKIYNDYDDLPSFNDEFNSVYIDELNMVDINAIYQEALKAGQKDNLKLLRKNRGVLERILGRMREYDANYAFSADSNNEYPLADVGSLSIKYPGVINEDGTRYNPDNAKGGIDFVGNEFIDVQQATMPLPENMAQLDLTGIEGLTPMLVGDVTPIDLATVLNTPIKK